MATQSTRSSQTGSPSSAASNVARRQSLRKRLRADQNGVLIAAGIMGGVGWVLLYQLIETSPPRVFSQWLFFILLYIVVTATASPFVWYLNRRFSRTHPVTGGIMLRQSMWFGLYAVTASWLQMLRALNGASAFFLALSMIVIETFLRLRERSQSSQ